MNNTLIETNKQTKKKTKQNKKFLIDSTNKQNKKKNTIVAKTNKHIETDDQEKDKKVKNPRNKKKKKKIKRRNHRLLCVQRYRTTGAHKDFSVLSF